MKKYCQESVLIIHFLKRMCDYNISKYKCAYLLYSCFFQAARMAQWVALSPHSKEVLGSNPRRPGPLCAEFACSPRVCVGFLRVLRFPPTVQRHAGALGREWAVWMPQSIEALSGSCVLIPCRFEMPEYNSYYGSPYDYLLKRYPDSVTGLWRKDRTTVFDSRSQSESHLKGMMTGNLLQKRCTTVLENLPKYYNSPPKPKLTTEKVEVMEGTSVSLSCSAAAPCPKLPPNLTWTPRLSDSVDQLQENEDNTTSVSSDLTFTASHLHHRQKITCRALYTLQQGGNQRMSEASLTLKVRYPPKKTSVSVSPSGSVLEGSSVILTCSSKARPTVQNYTWYRVNGTEMNTVGNGQNLTFNVTESSGSEQYYCEAQNEHGKENSTAVQLGVNYPPKKTSVSVSPSGSVLEGSSVTLTCRSKARPPVQNYTWYRVNGTEMNTVGTGQNLTFNVTESSGSEQHYCEAQNEHGKENSTTVQLGVNYPPKKTSVSVSPSGSVLEGSSVTLTCSSKASPPVQNYTWYRVNGTEMNTVGTGQNLTFNVTESSGSEQYYCEAQNEHGKENSTTVLLNVIYLPQISGSGSCSRTAAEISCSCESRGNPSPSMEWRVSGLRVTNSTDRVIREEQLGNTGLRSSLTMRHSQGDTATLLCLSTNALGTSSLQLHAPSPQQHSDFSIPSLLIGAAAGAGAMMCIFLIMQLVLKKKRHSHGSQVKDTEGLILMAGMATQDEESANANKTTLSDPGAVGKGNGTSLHYATVDFSKLRSTGGNQGTGVIRGTSQRTSDYAVIRHRSREEGEEVQGEVEVEKEGPAELGAERETAEVRGGQEGEPERECLPNVNQQPSINPDPVEEATYGNICRSRPTKRAQQGQQETRRNPAPEEEEQREEGQEDMYVDLMSPLTEGGGKGVEESEYAEVRKLQ
ncbi:B-cell receptor CD22-like isoform X2 [Conger conger]|uniref:B-cell receptor CD22-like isoform X2 n=1 Tax=Conger conger TaxID=82655 RepID=UPI002A59BA00|nr:B-cell receptor CD22-like isoform X2 [Conger conger]